MANKYLKIGSVIKSIRKDGSENFSIGLGTKGKNPQYDLSVELIVKDNTGKIVGRQVDGFVNLINPRTEANDLLKAGVIDEARAAQMNENVQKLPEKIKFTLKIPALNG